MSLREFRLASLTAAHLYLMLLPTIDHFLAMFLLIFLLLLIIDMLKITSAKVEYGYAKR